MPSTTQQATTSKVENISIIDRLWSLIGQLLGAIEHLSQEKLRLTEDNQHLRDEIAVLKGEKAKPKFKPSGMEKDTESKPATGTVTSSRDGEKPSKRPGSAKCSKTQDLVIHQEIKIAPTRPVPEGSRFKGYSEFVVQDLIIAPNNTRYLLEVWQTPAGEIVRGEVPSHLNGGHFGPTLRAYVLDQYHSCQVTQRPLHEQLERWNVQISVGQIDALLSEHNEPFCDEANQTLVTGLEVSSSITVDDSGARHQGKNGYVTQIGNEWFAWFASNYSKSRINFLELLQAGTRRYNLNEHAIDYMREQGLPSESLQNLQAFPPHGLGLTDSKHWNQYLDTLDITAERHRKIATEGALLGGLVNAGFSKDLVIVSDGAGQFTIPLRTNGSESDIRSYVKRRKVSGGTRSDLGKRGRDAFASLNKTCCKLGVSFWDYLVDRIEQLGKIAPLSEIVRQKATAVP